MQAYRKLTLNGMCWSANVVISLRKITDGQMVFSMSYSNAVRVDVTSARLGNTPNGTDLA